ncbi:MAG: hypothetical protein KGJ89_00900 [Patescibacteria group bacterium]|nr:hypothetical protein [Patescibacteria group bacterium]MDE2015071.1 hypothetical protein [Patescibacteria group bacterium]MDE2226499.1 hypothetical protein [Patescibacteria group bacterium]
MTWKKILSWGVFFILVLALPSTPKTLADNTATCNLSQDKFDAIKSIEHNFSLGDLERIKEELAIRKQLIAETIGCAISEAQGAKSEIDGINSNDPDTQKLKSQYSDQLDGVISYYNLQASKINDLGLQGSKNFAANLGSWRKTNYEPLAKNADNLVMWSQNQELIQIAQTRLNQLRQTVTLLNIVDNGTVQDLWQKANSNWNDATVWNQAAKESLQTFGSPDETLNSIKSSLASLSDVYQNFLDLLSAMGKNSSPQ